MTSVTFTTKDGETNVGNPFILGFTSDKTDESLLFSETYDLELPPPPPPPLANGLPDTSNYTTQLFVTVTDMNAYEYYIPEIITTEQSIQFAVRKSEGGNVTFTYDNSQIGQIFSKLEIVGGSSVSIDLLTNTAVSGVTIDGTTNTVTLASLGDGSYYTMNVQKVVEGISSDTITIATSGWNMISVPANATISAQNISNSIYWFDGAAYQTYTIEPASVLSKYKGFWIKTIVDNLDITINFSTPYIAPSGTDTITIATSGWNMISVPANATISAQNISNSIYWFDGAAYQTYTIDPASVLSKYKGFWIKTIVDNLDITITYE